MASCSRSSTKWPFIPSRFQHRVRTPISLQFGRHLVHGTCIRGGGGGRPDLAVACVFAGVGFFFFCYPSGGGCFIVANQRNRIKHRALSYSKDLSTVAWLCKVSPVFRFRPTIVARPRCWETQLNPSCCMELMTEEFRHLNDRMDSYEAKIVSFIHSDKSYLSTSIHSFIYHPYSL
jgi:hypothetical protein